MPLDPALLPARNLERSFQKSPRLAFALLATVQVTLILAITVTAIALPALGAELGLRSGQLALVSAGYGLAFGGLLLLGGRLADLLGPRRMLIIGLAGFGLASAAAGLSPDFWRLLGSRLAQGTGAALAAPAAMALLRDVYPDRDRHARAVALWGGLAPLGATAGIALSGVAATWGSWRWAFALPAAVAAVAAVAAMAAPRLLPPGAPPTPAKLDLPGALLATLGIATISYGLVTAGDQGWASRGTVISLLAGTVVLAGFVTVEYRSAAPLVPLRFLRSTRRVAGLAALAMAAAGHASIGFFLALYLQQVRGLSPLVTTAAFLPFLLTLPLAGSAATRLLTRFPPYAVATGGLVTAAAGLLLLGQLAVDTPYAGTLLAGLLVFPAGAALTFAAATVVAVQDAPAHQGGLAAGLVNTAVELGPTLGLALLVSLAGTRTAGLLDAGHPLPAATSGGYGFALDVAAAGFTVAAAGTFWWGRRRSPPPTTGHCSPPPTTAGENP